MGKGKKDYAAALGQLAAIPTPKKKTKTKPKKTDVQINIRKINPAGYAISVFRPGVTLFGPSVSEEFYVARTIEEVEAITSSLLRSGTVPAALGGA